MAEGEESKHESLLACGFLADELQPLAKRGHYHQEACQHPVGTQPFGFNSLFDVMTQTDAVGRWGEGQQTTAG